MLIREATADDLPQLIRLIRLKAEFDGAAQSVRATEQKLKETLFGRQPMAYVLLAAMDEHAEPIGFASYHFIYSTFLAQPGIWLDDLFVEGDYRNRSIGAYLMRSLCKIATERDCGRIDWTVAVENSPGIRFYQRMGGQLQTQVHLCRMDRGAIARGASEVSASGVCAC